MESDERKAGSDEENEERDELDDLDVSEQQAEDVKGGARARPRPGL